MTEQAKEIFELRPNHVGISVRDMETSIAWYRDMLGFSEVRRNWMQRPFQMVLMSNGVFNIELFEIKDASQMSVNHPYSYGGIDDKVGIKQLAFEVDDLQKLTQMLESKGGNITLRGPDGTARFIHDNSGNAIEFVPRGWVSLIKALPDP